MDIIMPELLSATANRSSWRKLSVSSVPGDWKRSVLFFDLAKMAFKCVMANRRLFKEWEQYVQNEVRLYRKVIDKIIYKLLDFALLSWSLFSQTWTEINNESQYKEKNDANLPNIHSLTVWSIIWCFRFNNYQNFARL